MLQSGDGADRKARGKTAAEAGRDQPVARFHVRGQRQVGHQQLVGVAGAVCDAAQAGARNHHRHRMIGIDDQHRHRSMRQGLNDLAHHAARVDHDLTHVHALVVAHVQHHVVARRPELHVDQPRQLRVHTEHVLRIQQLLQAHVLVGDCVHAIEACLGQQQRLAQLAVFVDQVATLGERGVGVMDPVGRRRGELVDRHDRGCCGVADAVQPAVAMVQHHQHRGQRKINNQAQRARRRVREDRSGFLLRKRHGGAGGTGNEGRSARIAMSRHCVTLFPGPGFARHKSRFALPESSPFRGTGAVTRYAFPSPESRAPSPSLAREEIAAMHVDQLQRTAAAACDAGQRILGDLHVQAGFLGNQLVQVAQ